MSVRRQKIYHYKPAKHEEPANHKINSACCLSEHELQPEQSSATVCASESHFWTKLTNGSQEDNIDTIKQYESSAEYYKFQQTNWKHIKRVKLFQRTTVEAAP